MICFRVGGREGDRRIGSEGVESLYAHLADIMVIYRVLRMIGESNFYLIQCSSNEVVCLFFLNSRFVWAFHNLNCGHRSIALAQLFCQPKFLWRHKIDCLPFSCTWEVLGKQTFAGQWTLDVRIHVAVKVAILALKRSLMLVLSQCCCSREFLVIDGL